MYRRWFARLHGYLNEKFPRIFGNLLITAKKNGQLNERNHDIEFIEILRCPVTKERLHLEIEKAMLINESRTFGYKLYEGIPILIKEDAIKL